MKLYELLNYLEFKVLGETNFDLDVKDIKVGSGKIRKGDLFVAIKGEKFDGHEFIEDAITHGAVAVIAENEIYLKKYTRAKIPLILVNNTRYVYARLASKYFKNPSQHLKVIGITGTNGKTTTAYLLQHILQRRHPCGLISTIAYDSGDRCIPATNTTPCPYVLNQLMAEMLNNYFRYCVMEVSSHALEQLRCVNIDFNAAIFTNLTQDHLDYHKTMEKYFQSKAKLFREYSQEKWSILNIDDTYGKQLAKEIRHKVVTYGQSDEADVKASNITMTLEGVTFAVCINDKTYTVRSPLIARHNVYNILAAFAFAYKEGIAIMDIIESIGTFTGVMGRLERVDCGQEFYVFIDYAHTPDAFENVLQSLKPLVLGNIITVFGCGGNRDQKKRPLMGAQAAAYSNHIIITNDNPRFEDEEAILKDIERGIVKKGTCSYTCIPDRKKAIREALSIAKKGDVVLLLGKGHEEYIIRKDKKIPFSDRQVATEYFQGVLTDVNSA